jgi:hypothetical protein
MQPQPSGDAGATQHPDERIARVTAILSRSPYATVYQACDEPPWSNPSTDFAQLMTWWPACQAASVPIAESLRYE